MAIPPANDLTQAAAPTKTEAPNSRTRAASAGDPEASRRRTSLEERAQARDVARFVAAIDEPGDTLSALVLISKFFPDIKLETALAGWVFRALLVNQARVLQ